MNKKTKYLIGGLFFVGALVVGSSFSSANENINKESNSFSLNSRGLRNNNPLNLMGGGGWVGLVGKDAQGFLIFDTLENGFRAGIINLKNQQKIHGLKTVYEIVKKWTSGDSEQEQYNYADYVSKYMGVDMNRFVDLSGYIEKNILNYIFASFEIENGRNKLSTSENNRIKDIIYNANKRT